MSQLAFTTLPSTGGLRFQQFETAGRRAAVSQPKSWNAEARTFEAVLASETPCRTYRWTTDWSLVEVEEILPMSALKNIAAIRGRPLLDAHNSWSVRDIVGVIEDAWIEGKNLVIRARLSDRDEVRGIASDIAGGIINSLSVGFEILKDGKVVERAGRAPLVEVASWSVREGSLVPDPADKTAKIRSAAPHLNNSNGSNVMDIETFRTQFAARHAARAAADATAIMDDVVALLTATPAPVVETAPVAVTEPGARTAADTAAIATLRTAVAGRSADLLPSFDALATTGAPIATLQEVLTRSLASPTQVSTTQTQKAGARQIADIRFEDTSAGKLAAGK